MNRRFLCVNRLADVLKRPADVLKRPADVLKRPDDSAAWADSGAGGQTKILTSGEVSGILLKYPVQTILAGVAQWQRN